MHLGWVFRDAPHPWGRCVEKSVLKICESSASPCGQPSIPECGGCVVIRGWVGAEGPDQGGAADAGTLSIIQSVRSQPPESKGKYPRSFTNAHQPGLVWWLAQADLNIPRMEEDYTRSQSWIKNKSPLVDEGGTVLEKEKHQEQGDQLCIRSSCEGRVPVAETEGAGQRHR